MLISREHGFAFIHNPKVAGTSIRKALEQYHDHPTTFWHQGRYGRRVHDLAHIPAMELTREDAGALTDEGLYTFGFVRHPVNRFWSGLHEFRRQHADWAISKLSAEDLLCSVFKYDALSSDWRFVHLSPQWRFFPITISEGIRSIHDAVKVFHYESFHEDWVEVTRNLNSRSSSIPAYIPLNNARHREKAIVEPLSNRAWNKLLDIYELDFAFFGYTQTENTHTEWPPRMYQTHWQRIEAIHGLDRPEGIEPYLTPGESAAYKEKWQ